VTEKLWSFSRRWRVIRRIYTIGHSNRSLDEFLRLIFKYEVKAIADVRRFPSSRHQHFKKENLKEILATYDIDYIWIEALGGYRRQIVKESPNIAIQSEGFRNYADYMLTDEFLKAIGELENIASVKRTAIMCAEKFFWKCHRKFISDFLVVRGWKILHILDDKLLEHKLSETARVDSDKIIYDKIANNKQ